jgi:hypothetical protein
MLPSVEMYAGLDHAAGALSDSSSGISMMSTAWRKTRSGRSIFQPLHSFSQMCLMWSLKIPTAINIIIIIIWHYYPLLVFTFSARSLQVLLSLAVSFQFF